MIYVKVNYILDVIFYIFVRTKTILMKITNIKMSDVKDGKPFNHSTWRSATPKEKAKVFNTIAKFTNVKMAIA